MKRLLTIIGILIVLVLLANWWSGRVISSHIDEQFTHILGQEGAINLTYESISVSPLLSRITFSGFTYRTGDHIEFRAQSIRSSLTYRDFIRLLTSDSPNTFNKISFLSLYFNNSSLIDHPKATELTLNDGFFTLRGNLGETLRAGFNRRMPHSSLTLEMDIYDLRDQSLDATQGFLPGFQRNDHNFTVNMARGSFEYDPVLDKIHLRDVELRAPSLEMEISGTGEHTTNRKYFFPTHYNIYYKLRAQPGETRFTLSPRAGQISMGKVSLESTAVLDITNLSEFSFDNLITDGETRFDLDRVRFFPSDYLIQEYGMMAQAFGLDISSLYFNRLEGQYTLNNDRLVVHGTELTTNFFSALLNVDLSLNDQTLSASTVNEGSLRISRMTPSIQDFIDDAEVLFSTRFERVDEEEVVIRFRGPLTAPVIVR